MKRRGLEFNKRAQMKLSFGMIFSILLIIFFLAFAFFGIKKLIEVQQNTQINLFAKDLQSDVDKLWNSNSGSNKLTYNLPSKVQKVCFENEEENLIIYRKDGSPYSKKINHLNMEETLSLYGDDIICIENLNNKISFYIEKAYGDNFVVLTFEEN
jgi:uncharacterized protein (UPF0333 family)